MSAHKKIKKGPRIILLILILMNIIAYGYLSYGLYLLSGIETILRYAGIIILLIINFLIVAFAIKSVKKSRIGKFDK